MFLLYTITIGKLKENHSLMLKQMKLFFFKSETFHPKVRDFSPDCGVKSPNLETNIKWFKKYNSNYSTSKPVWPIMPNTIMYMLH